MSVQKMMRSIDLRTQIVIAEDRKSVQCLVQVFRLLQIAKKAQRIKPEPYLRRVVVNLVDRRQQRFDGG